MKTAWINNSIKSTPLVHSIQVSDATLVVYGEELREVLQGVTKELHAAGIREAAAGSWFCDPLRPYGANDMDRQVLSEKHDVPSRELRDGVKYTDTMCYIYTSGNVLNLFAPINVFKNLYILFNEARQDYQKLQLCGIKTGLAQVLIAWRF